MRAMLLRRAFLLTAIIVCAGAAYGQIIPRLFVTPQPPAYFADWQTQPYTVQLTVTNTGNTAINGKISTTISSVNANRIASTSAQNMPMVMIPAHSTITFGTADLLPFNAVQFEGPAAASMARTGKLPGDHYTICASLVDANAQTPLSDPACGMFSVTSYQPPILLSPPDNAQLTEGSLRGTMFHWTPVTPMPSNAACSIRFSLLKSRPGSPPRVPLQRINHS